MENIEKIKQYIKEWNSIQDCKPQNDLEFIERFTIFMISTEADQWDFSGENGYCGYTAHVNEYSAFLPVTGIGFEFAYGKDFVKVFTNRHHGFWTPEYISLKGDNSKMILGILKEKYLAWGGFSNEN